MTYQLHHGNMLDILPMMERDSIDAVICDPPYGLDFMGKDWDHGVPGEHFWREVFRVAKPGAMLLAFGGTRTFHRLAVAIEDAGWELRDTIMWVYGSGFPKSHDVSKAIDKAAGAERIRVGRRVGGDGRPLGRDNGNAHLYEGYQRPWRDKPIDEQPTAWETSPATPAAAEWDGWGTALKPAWEPIIVARKPLVGTVAENVLRYGAGGMNIDQCRIGNDERTYSMAGAPGGNSQRLHGGDGRDVENAIRYAEESKKKPDVTVSGRWPANLIHDGSAEVLAGFPVMTATAIGGRKPTGTGGNGMFSGGWNTEENCHGDTGSAARFFYAAKASKADRDEGCEGLEERVSQNAYGDFEGTEEHTTNVNTKPRNVHPCVKPTSLMRYLCKLVTPPNGTILDPFMGSGSTGKAAMLEGFNFVGVDTEIEYVEIAARRIEAACGRVGIIVDQPMMFDNRREAVDAPKQMILL